MKEIVYYFKSELHKPIKGYEDESYVYKTSKYLYAEFISWEGLLNHFPEDKYNLVDVEYENLYKM